MLIIAVFLLSFSGCGYKASPYYQDDAPKGDKNIDFKIKKIDNNTTKSGVKCDTM